jgi:hypothetical protein
MDTQNITEKLSPSIFKIITFLKREWIILGVREEIEAFVVLEAGRKFRTYIYFDEIEILSTAPNFLKNYSKN